MNKLLFLILFLVIKSDDRVKIDIYTESLCPDCIEFMEGSFEKAVNLEDFRTICDYNIYPYGNAKQQQNGDSWDFTCQHGQNECYGNVIENCGRKYLDDSVYYVWLICVENLVKNKHDFDQAARFCGAIIQQDVDQVLNCANTSEGNQLQHIVADKTESLNPPHNYVPWVVVNGNHDLNQEGQVLQNMIKFVCENYKGSIILPGCGKDLQQMPQQTIIDQILHFLA